MPSAYTSTKIKNNGESVQWRVAFNTLGCKLNQYESDALAARFVEEGYGIVPFHEQADVYIINSCTVTNKADRKSRNILSRAERAARESQSMVVLTGCYVDSHRDELESKGRSFVVDNEHKSSIFELVDAHLRGEIFHAEESLGDRFAYALGRQIFRTRGMLKIQDGCDNFCSFCIIPFVRGRAASRPLPDIVEAAQAMLAFGYRELVLTGVNMSRYSYEGLGFSDLLERLLNLETDSSQYRLRISSIEPENIDSKFIELLGHPRMTCHLHLCLQSASEKILLGMRRQYSYRGYREICAEIRQRYPHFNITSDIIIGFPGESAEEFEHTRRSLREIGFGHVHVFPYSVRRGTRAERSPGHVAEQIKHERSEIIRQEAEEQKRLYRSALIGMEQLVLVEGAELRETQLVLRGLGEHYVPVQVPVQVDSEQPDSTQLENSFIRVRITGIAEGEDPELFAEAIK